MYCWTCFRTFSTKKTEVWTIFVLRICWNILGCSVLNGHLNFFAAVTVWLYHSYISKNNRSYIYRVIYLNFKANISFIFKFILSAFLLILSILQTTDHIIQSWFPENALEQFLEWVMGRVPERVQEWPPRFRTLPCAAALAIMNDMHAMKDMSDIRHELHERCER